MKIRFAADRPDNGAPLVLPVKAGGVADALGALGLADLGGLAASERFDGEAGSTLELVGAGRRLILVGVGKSEGIAAAEKVASAGVARLMASGAEEIVVDLSGDGFDAEAGARGALAAAMRGWRFDRYRTTMPERQKISLQAITIVADKGAEARWNERYDAVLAGTSLTRELVTEPANIIYPESFVERVTKSVAGLGLKVRILDEKDMAKLGMGALLGVAQGSARKPRLLALEWMGGKEGEAPLAFVGKGVTFDTGGISIKPAPGMEAMKWDMGGAGAVAGAMKTLAARKAKANVVGVMGLVENMPDGNAQRPGDVVTTMSGQTVEVLNTDAEGRLVLCDAISWVQQEYKPSRIVDLATLTGAMVVTFGHEYAGMFANDDTLATDLLKASEESGDALWRQPLGDAYDKLIDSPIADMKNIGPREAGSITAAQFIKRFVDEGQAWAHLDIAGVAWSDTPRTHYGKGATGFGVRLLDQLVADTIEG